MKKLTIEIEFQSLRSMDKLLNLLRIEIMKNKTSKNGHALNEAMGTFKIEEIKPKI